MTSARSQSWARATGNNSANAVLRQMQRDTSTLPWATSPAARFLTFSRSSRSPRPSWIRRPDIELAHHGALGQLDGVKNRGGDVVRPENFLGIGLEHGLIA